MRAFVDQVTAEANARTDMGVHAGKSTTFNSPTIPTQWPGIVRAPAAFVPGRFIKAIILRTPQFIVLCTLGTSGSGAESGF